MSPGLRNSKSHRIMLTLTHRIPVAHMHLSCLWLGGERVPATTEAASNQATFTVCKNFNDQTNKWRNCACQSGVAALRDDSCEVSNAMPCMSSVSCPP